MGICKKEIFSDNLNLLSEIFAILGSSARLAIIYYLQEHGTATVGELTASISLAQSTISEHIKILRKISLVRGHRIGTSMHYYLNAEIYTELKNVFRDCAEGF